MPSFHEIKIKVEEICEKLNRECADLRSEVTYNNGLQIIIKGRNLIGEEVGHPLSCGLFHTTPVSLADEEFWIGTYDAIVTVLRGLPLSLEQVRFIPSISHVLEAIEREFGGQAFGLIIVTMDDIHDPTLPLEIKRILREARRRNNAPLN